MPQFLKSKSHNDNDAVLIQDTANIPTDKYEEPEEKPVLSDNDLQEEKPVYTEKTSQ